MEQYLSNILGLAIKYPFIKTIFFSLLLVLFLIVLRKLIFINIDKKKLTKVEKTFLKKKVSQYVSYFTILLLFLFWFAQLQVLLVSLLAIAAAIVIALKELIMCVTGGFLIRSSKSFVAAQRIEIGAVRGFVVEPGLFVTKLLEIGPESNSQQTTGNIITIPNSMVLSNPLKNESYFKGYSIKSYQFRIYKLDNVEKFEKMLLQKAQEFCSGYLEDAKKSISNFCEKEGIAIPSVNARTKLLLDEENKDFLILAKVPVQNANIGDLEQELNRFYLHWKIEYNDSEVRDEK